MLIQPNILYQGLFTNRYHAVQIRIYEMGLLFHFRNLNLPAEHQASVEATSANLLKCVEAIKQYLDTFLVLDTASFSSLPFEEWFRLIIAFFILYKLSAGPRDMPEWDVKLCRSRIHLEAYLTAVACRIRETAPTLACCPSPRDELYFVLPLVLESARDSYVLARDHPILLTPDHRVHVDLRRPIRLGQGAGPASAPKCPATGFWIDKALTIDRESDWNGVTLSGSLHPAEQLSKNEDLWKHLLNGHDDAG